MNFFIFIIFNLCPKAPTLKVNYKRLLYLNIPR